MAQEIVCQEKNTILENIFLIFEFFSQTGFLEIISLEPSIILYSN
jgi:hypothetical protein